MAIARLWFFTLNPTTSITDPAFLSLWTDVLALLARYTPSPGPSTSHVQTALLSQPCPKRAHHFLLQVTDATPTTTTQQNGSSPSSSPPQPPSIIHVLISSYPSLALCTQADTAYTHAFAARMAAHVRHHALRQLDMEDAEVVPTLLAASFLQHHHHHHNESTAKEEPEPTVTVAISNSDPLVAEAMCSSSASLAGRTKVEVPPPHMEISGADVFVPPPLVSGGLKGGGGEIDGNGDGVEEEDDVWAVQRGEGRKWIRISRGKRPRMEEIDVESYRLRELMAQ